MEHIKDEAEMCKVIEEMSAPLPKDILTTWEALEPKLRENLKKHDRLLPVAFAPSPDGGPFNIIGMDFRNKQSMDSCVSQLRDMVEKCSSPFVIFVTEATAAMYRLEENETREELLSKVDKKVDHHVDVVVVTIQTMAKTWVALAPLKNREFDKLCFSDKTESNIPRLFNDHTVH